MRKSSSDRGVCVKHGSKIINDATKEGACVKLGNGGKKKLCSTETFFFLHGIFELQYVTRQMTVY